MNLPMMLTVVTVAVSVTVMGLLVAMTADDRTARARGWVWASWGLAIGVAGSALWHHAESGRFIALVLVLYGGILFDRLRPRAVSKEVDTTTTLTTEPLP